MPLSPILSLFQAIWLVPLLYPYRQLIAKAINNSWRWIQRSYCLFYCLTLYLYFVSLKEKKISWFVPIYPHFYSSCLWLKANVHNPQDSIILPVSEAWGGWPFCLQYLSLGINLYNFNLYLKSRSDVFFWIKVSKEPLVHFCIPLT